MPTFTSLFIEPVRGKSFISFTWFTVASGEMVCITTPCLSLPGIRGNEVEFVG